MSSSSKQQQKMGTAAESAESPLPMAVEGQLQWVKRSLSSLSVLTSSTGSDEDPPSMWWPSLLFNDYDDFQDFFSDEFGSDDKPSIEENNDDASETKGLILSRIFRNMRRQRTVMVARLLGRSIKEYVEIVEVPVEGDVEGEGKIDEVEEHEATKFVSFTRMPQEVHLPQIKPEAFIVASGNNMIIDDDLYMSYMFALDLAATKRIGGPKAPHDSLRSDFRDIGREELEKMSSTVQRLSKSNSAALTSNEEILKDQEPIGNEEIAEEESDYSDSDEEVVNKIIEQDNTLCEAAKFSKIQGEEIHNEAATAESTAQDTESTSPFANNNDDQSESKTPINCNGSRVKRGNDGENTADKPLVASLHGRPPKMNGKKSSLKKVSSPKTPDKKDEKDVASPDISSPPRRLGRRRRGTEGVHPLAFKNSSPVSFQNTRTVTIETSPSSTGTSSPGIKPHDSFEEACRKLEVVGYEIDQESMTYFSPNVTLDDVKMNPHWRGNKFFLSKEDFSVFLREEFGWKGKKTSGRGKKTPVTKSRKRSNAVTPTSSTRPKRTRRSPSFGRGNLNNSPMKQYGFKSEEEEEFYHFKNLMKQLKESLQWQYLPSKINPWHYVLPGRPRDSKGGKHLEDFFYEESEVILYCMNNNYYERRGELGLE